MTRKNRRTKKKSLLDRMRLARNKSYKTKKYQALYGISGGKYRSPKALFL